MPRFIKSVFFKSAKEIKDMEKKINDTAAVITANGGLVVSFLQPVAVGYSPSVLGQQIVYEAEQPITFDKDAESIGEANRKVKVLTFTYKDVDEDAVDAQVNAAVAELAADGRKIIAILRQTTYLASLGLTPLTIIQEIVYENKG